MDAVGIRITANGCLISDCRITRCMTGIVMMTLGNTISGCTIGERWLVEYGKVITGKNTGVPRMNIHPEC